MLSEQAISSCQPHIVPEHVRNESFVKSYQMEEITYLIKVSLVCSMVAGALSSAGDFGWLNVSSVNTHTHTHAQGRCSLSALSSSEQVRVWAQTCPASQVGQANQNYRCVPLCVSMYFMFQLQWEVWYSPTFIRWIYIPNSDTSAPNNSWKWCPLNWLNWDGVKLPSAWLKARRPHRHRCPLTSSVPVGLF